jgi:hypothetical protein
MQLAIGSSLIAVWAIIFPATIFFLINKERGRLNEVKNLKLYGIFYVGLNDDSFHWEIIVMNLRKLGIIVAATFINKNQSNFKVRILSSNLFAGLHWHVGTVHSPALQPLYETIH